MSSKASFHIQVMSLPRAHKKLALVGLDAFAIVLALWSAFALRFSELWPEEMLQYASVFVFAPIFGIGIFGKLGLYRAVMRHLRSTAVKSVLVGVLVLSVSVWLFGNFYDVAYPVAVVIIFALSSALYMGVTRLLIRNYYLWVVERFVERERVLVFGAGGAGVQLAKLLEAGAEYLPVGFADDDSTLWGSDVFGLRVYDPADLDDVITELRVSSILIALPSLSSEIRSEVAQRLARYHLKVKTIPSMPEIISGAAIDKLRDIQLEDLLGRTAVQPLTDLVDSSLERLVVCITGAGGSIGSELSRQALLSGASRILLIDNSEYALYKIEAELNEVRNKNQLNGAQIVPLLCSVLEEDRLAQLFREQGVHTVYHTAAYKHVPIVEANPIQGVENNTLGTLCAARAAEEAGVSRFVLVSTDKAVRPTNVMGASKRFAELILQSMASKESVTTIYSIVRFGNVLGSSGSVVPLFTKQIESGGPVTVTHPQINRYFMTINEAASLVIQAGAMAKGGEVFVLDMGEPVKIADLAERMIRLSGFEVKSASNPNGDIEIIFTGLRPGEKLFEELLIGSDIAGTGHPKIMCAEETKLTANELDAALTAIRKAIKSRNKERLTEVLVASVAGYRPTTNLPARGDKGETDTSKIVPIRGR